LRFFAIELVDLRRGGDGSVYRARKHALHALGRIRNGQRHHDAGMLLAKRADQFDREIRCVRRQRQRARLEAAGRIEQLPGIALATDHLPRHAEETPPELGRLDATRSALEQFDPEILLEPPHMVGDGRLRQR
jgi:hypothetical protein